MTVDHKTLPQKVKFDKTHVFKKRVEAYFASIGEEGSRGCGDFHAVEHGVHLKCDPLLLGKFLNLFVLQFVVGSYSFQNQLQGVEVRVSWKERQSAVNLSENTANRPHIYGPAVCRVSNEQLGRAVPAGGHVVRVLVVSLLDASGKSKVAKLDHAVLRNQDILWLYISVHNLRLVQKLHCLKHLVHNAPYFKRLNAFAVLALKLLKQIAAFIFKHQMQLLVLSEH